MCILSINKMILVRVKIDSRLRVELIEFKDVIKIGNYIKCILKSDLN